MPKVKILYGEWQGADYYDSWLVKDATDWEEVSEEEFKILQKNISLVPSLQIGFERYSPKLFVQDSTPVKKRVVEIIESLRVQAEEEAKRAEEWKKKWERQAKIKDAKTIEAKRKQLEKLKAELGEK